MQKKEKRKNSKLGVCPECKEAIVCRGDFYGCEGFRSGCSFAISINALAGIGHYAITPKQMRSLLRGPTQLAFKTANGSERLYMVELKKIEERWMAWIDFEAGSESEVLGTCPICGADVVESPLGFGCSRWEEGCEFTIWKNTLKRFGGKMLGKWQVKKLLSDGEIEVKILDFKRKERKVILLLDKEFGCKVNFG